MAEYILQLYKYHMSILENVPCALERNLYSVAFRWNALYIPIKFIWSNVSFKASVFLLIFCLDHLSIEVSGVSVKSAPPPSIVLLLISPFMAVNCLEYEVLIQQSRYTHNCFKLLIS